MSLLARLLFFLSLSSCAVTIEDAKVDSCKKIEITRHMTFEEKKEFPGCNMELKEVRCGKLHYRIIDCGDTFYLSTKRRKM